MGRPEGRPAPPPDWEELRTMTDRQMAELGMGLWSKKEGLRLFPREWFDNVPEGYTVHSINGKTFTWDPEIMSRDHRFGYLAYGVYPKEARD